MAYIITGPTQIGTNAQLNEILGNLRLTNISTTQGNLFSVDGSSNIVAVSSGNLGQVLTSNGAGTQPTFQNLVITPNEGFSVTKNAGSTFDNIITNVIGWSSVSQGRYNSGSFNTVTGIFTAPRATKYYIDAILNYTNNTNDGERTLELVYTPGDIIVSTITVQPTPNTSINCSISISTKLNLALGDTLRLRFYSDAASGTILDTSEFSIEV